MSSPNAADITRFRQLLTEHLGWQVDETKSDTLAGTLAARANVLNCSHTRYLDLLTSTASGELAALARELTITETYFLRYGDQFTAFVEVALPDRLASKAEDEPVHILSMGCASGEEPYSLAISVRERHPGVADRVAITAADINPAMLDKARRARYSPWSLREVPPAVQSRWFISDEQTYALSPEITRAVRFEARNLALDDPVFWSPARFDIIFCRNLLMYFTPEQAQAAVRRLATALAPNGYLFLGHAENLRGLSNEFHVCHSHEAFYYRRDPQRRGLPMPSAWKASPLPAMPQRAGIDTSWVDTIRQASERIAALSPAAATNSMKALVRAAPDLSAVHESLQRERYDQAIAHLDQLPDEHDTDCDVLLLRAVALCHSGAVVDAEAVCQALLEADELNAAAHYVLALCRENIGDIAGAREHDQIACYLDDDFAMPRMHLGLLARRSGDAIAAARELRHAATLLQREDPSRVLMFGGGFKREALMALCRSTTVAMGDR